MAKSLKRIYVVTRKHDNVSILVEAATASQAMNAVTKETYDIKVATGIEVASLVRSGAPVIQAVAKESLVPAQTPESIPEDGGADEDSIGGAYRSQGE